MNKLQRSLAQCGCLFFGCNKNPPFSFFPRNLFWNVLWIVFDCSGSNQPYMASSCRRSMSIKKRGVVLFSVHRLCGRGCTGMLEVNIDKLLAQRLQKKQTRAGRPTTNRGRFISLHCLSLPEVIRSVVFLAGLLHFIAFIVLVIFLGVFFLFSVRIWRRPIKGVLLLKPTQRKWWHSLEAAWCRVRELTFRPFFLLLLLFFLLTFAHPFVVRGQAEVVPAQGFPPLHSGVHIHILLKEKESFTFASGRWAVCLILFGSVSMDQARTSSVSPVHMRRRSTSRFCLMLLMLSISWRTASAVLRTNTGTNMSKLELSIATTAKKMKFRDQKLGWVHNSHPLWISLHRIEETTMQ